MDINKGLLFYDGQAVSETAKVLDLGFSGDFDHHNKTWNRLFIAFPKSASGTPAALLLKVYAKQDGLPSVDDDGDDYIGTLTIPADKVKTGGTFAFDPPSGLKRYVTVGVEGTTAPAKVTCGFTNEVDTDCVMLGGGVDWTNYKAETEGTAVTGTPMKNVADVIKG